MGLIKECQWLTENEVKTLKESAEYHVLKTMSLSTKNRQLLIVMGLGTGLRCVELAGIHIEHFSPKDGMLKVWRAKKRKGCSEDMIKLKDSTALFLREFIKADGRKSGKLFVGQRGPLSRRGLQELFKRACVLAGAGVRSELSIHSMRHTVGHELTRKNLGTACRMLGHSDSSLTYKFYGGLDANDCYNAMNQTNL